MSEAENIELEQPETSVWASFPEKVWRTLSLIDMTSYVSVKEVTVKAKGDRPAYKFSLDYISWVTAWQKLMECFPESVFEFDEPRFFANGTGEQWIILTVTEGDQSMIRKWWLPYMDQRNQPVTDPSATQINNTRMRVLVKCIAMCGLGIEIYGGEDVQDQQQDAEPVPGVMPSVRKIVLDDLDFDEAARDDWIEKFGEIMPSKDSIDYDALTKAYHEFGKLGDLTVAIYDGLNSWQRAEIGKIRRDVQERKRIEAVGKITGDNDE